MAWPTVAEIKAKFSKLDNAAFTTPLQVYIDEAKDIILSLMARSYDVSTWTTSTPPVLKALAADLTYALFTLKTHTGARQSPSDETGEKVYERVMALLEKYATGEYALVDSDYALIDARAYTGSGFVRLRTDGPIFTVDDVSEHAVTLPDEDDPWE